MTIRVWKSLLAIAIIFSNVGWASDKESEGTALIKHAIQLTDLSESGPYRLGIRLSVVDEAIGKREGTDAITFSSTRRWRRDLHMTGYDEVALFLGNTMYRTRNPGFTPPSLRRDIAGSLRNLPETLNFKILRVYNHKVSDVEARCVYLEQKNGGQAEIRWCFDPSTGLPLAMLSGNGHRRIEFSNYKPLGNKFVPGSVEVLIEGKQTGKAVIERVDPGIPDPSHAFEPPAGATVRQWCDDMEGPIFTSGGRPDIPPAAHFGTGIALHYELTVDAGGNVTSITPMAASPYADRIAMETMRGWQFKPAMCDHTPVPTDIVINLGALKP